MRWTIPSLPFVLLTTCVVAQGPSTDKAETGAIERVKALLVSSLDRDLPRVTLEFFLKYEGGGAPIEWALNDCSEKARDAAADQHDPSMCVQAEISLKDGRAATVLVSVGRKKGVAHVPSVYGVRVTYPGGTTHQLPRLSDLPVELHRPVPKGPKDVPPPVVAWCFLKEAGPPWGAMRVYRWATS